MVISKIKYQKKKGQIIGQAFIFILAAILFSLILLFGYKAIGRIGETQSEVELIEFKDGLSSAVNKVRLDFGSVKKYSMNVPNQYKGICFVDLDYLLGPRGVPKLDNLRDIKPLIVDAIESGTDQNVFTTPLSKTPLKVGKIHTGNVKDANYPAYTCLDNTGVIIYLRLEGMGDSTQITLWPTQ